MSAIQSVKQLVSRWARARGAQREAGVSWPKQGPRADEWSVTFEGRYASWDEVAALTGVNVFSGVSKDYRASMRTSTDDWDRYFTHFEIGLLAAVMSAMAATRSPQKTIVDFGGGFGVHFLTLLKANLIPCKWEVIELKEVVELGAQKWQHNSNIQFFETLASSTRRPDLVIASGVLQSLPDPYAAVRQIAALEPSFLFIDRLPVTDEDRDVYTVQRIGAGFFGVERTAPRVLFSRKKFVAELARDFDLLFRFPGIQDPSQEDFGYEAMFLRRREAERAWPAAAGESQMSSAIFNTRKA